MHTTRDDLARLLTTLRLRWESRGTHEIHVPAIGLRIAFAPVRTHCTLRRMGALASKILAGDVGDGMIVCPGRAVFVDATDGCAGISQALLVACRECGGWYFCGESGAWRCRHCGAWDGNDHVFDVHDVSVWTGRIMLVDPLGIAVSAARFAQDIRQAA